MEYDRQLLYMVFAAIFGSLIGSFLNVVIYRLPRGESIVSPPSHCPKCNARIKWYDNLPLLSYIALGGRCRSCKTGISLRYPLVEFITAFFFVAFYATDVIGLFGEPRGYAVFAVHCALVAALIAITFIDFDLRIIPDEISIGGTVAALIISAWLPGLLAPVAGFLTGLEPHLAGGLNSVLGALAGGGITLATAVFGKLAFKKDAMGMGDVKLMAMLGALLGWQAAVLIFFMAPFAGLAIALPRKIITGDSYIAYGPFLAIACVVYVFFESRIQSLFPLIFG